MRGFKLGKPSYVSSALSASLTGDERFLRERGPQKHPVHPPTLVTTFRGKGSVAAEQGEKHYFAEDVARAAPSHRQDPQHKEIWAGLNQKRVSWPLCVGIIIAADEFHISNKGKILNRASVERLGGIRKQ